MSNLIPVLVLFFTIILQVKIAPLFSVKNARPDFLLIAVLAVTFHRNRIWGIASAFVTGIIFDIMGSGILGLSSLTKSVAAYLAGFIGSERLETGLGGVAGLLVVVLLIHDCLYYSILNIGSGMSFLKVILTYAMPSTAYSFSFMLMIHLVRPRILWGAPGVRT